MHIYLLDVYGKLEIANDVGFELIALNIGWPIKNFSFYVVEQMDKNIHYSLNPNQRFGIILNRDNKNMASRSQSVELKRNRSEDQKKESKEE